MLLVVLHLGVQEQTDGAITEMSISFAGRIIANNRVMDSAEQSPLGSEESDLGTPVEWQHLSFTQDAKAMVVGGESGFRLYTIYGIEKPRRVVESHGNATVENASWEVRDVTIVECFPNEKNLVLTLKVKPNIIFFYDGVNNSYTGYHIFPTTILSLKTSTMILAVGLASAIHVFILEKDNYSSIDSVVGTTVVEIVPNHGAIMDLTPCNKSLLSYPDQRDDGSVIVQNFTNEAFPRKKIKAHNHSIAALRFDHSARLLATASFLGTVIRIFDLHDDVCIHAFRRGLCRNVTVHSLAFSADSNYLCLSSNTETVHVLKLAERYAAQCYPEDEYLSDNDESSPREETGWCDYLAQTARSAVEFTQRASEYVLRPRHFVAVTLPEVGEKNIAALKMIDSKLYILVATSKHYFVYAVDTENGTATLEDQHIFTA